MYVELYFIPTGYTTDCFIADAKAMIVESMEKDETVKQLTPVAWRELAENFESLKTNYVSGEVTEHLRGDSSVRKLIDGLLSKFAVGAWEVTEGDEPSALINVNTPDIDHEIAKIQKLSMVRACF
jgi:uncharacterized protein YlbG (UPF0298 family)